MTPDEFTALAGLCAVVVWSVQIVTDWRAHRAAAAYMRELRAIAAARREQPLRPWMDCQ